MRWSQFLIPTVKEVPAEAEIASHQLMIRAGLIRKLASGTYTYMPLGYRSLLKVMQIVREEMNAADAQEIFMPIVQPIELWEQTGRDVVYKDILGVFTDHHGRKNALAPTALEMVRRSWGGMTAADHPLGEVVQKLLPPSTLPPALSVFQHQPMPRSRPGR